MNENFENMIQEKAEEITEGIVERDCGKLVKGLVIGGGTLVVGGISYAAYKLGKKIFKKGKKTRKPKEVVDTEAVELEVETEEVPVTEEVKEEN